MLLTFQEFTKINSLVQYIVHRIIKLSCEPICLNLSSVAPISEVLDAGSDEVNWIN